jgi:general secretion pathway protein G
MHAIPSKRKRGFTLIEIMAVVVIIGLLMAIVGPRVLAVFDQGNVTTTGLQLNSIKTALSTYYMDNGRFPSTEQGLRALIEKPTTPPEARGWRPGGYLDGKSIPQDAWKQDFQYAYPGERNPDSYDLWSPGADGQAGGSGTAADIGNWAAEEAPE